MLVLVSPNLLPNYPCGDDLDYAPLSPSDLNRPGHCWLVSRANPNSSTGQSLPPASTWGQSPSLRPYESEADRHAHPDGLPPLGPSNFHLYMPFNHLSVASSCKGQPPHASSPGQHWWPHPGINAFENAGQGSDTLYGADGDNLESHQCSQLLQALPEAIRGKFWQHYNHLGPADDAPTLPRIRASMLSLMFANPRVQKALTALNMSGVCLVFRDPSLYPPKLRLGQYGRLVKNSDTGAREAAVVKETLEVHLAKGGLQALTTAVSKARGAAMNCSQLKDRRPLPVRLYADLPEVCVALCLPLEALAYAYGFQIDPSLQGLDFFPGVVLVSDTGESGGWKRMSDAIYGGPMTATMMTLWTDTREQYTRAGPWDCADNESLASLGSRSSGDLFAIDGREGEAPPPSCGGGPPTSEGPAEEPAVWPGQEVSDFSNKSGLAYSPREDKLGPLEVPSPTTIASTAGGRSPRIYAPPTPVATGWSPSTPVLGIPQSPDARPPTPVGTPSDLIELSTEDSDGSVVSSEDCQVAEVLQRSREEAEDAANRAQVLLVLQEDFALETGATVVVTPRDGDCIPCCVTGLRREGQGLPSETNSCKGELPEVRDSLHREVTQARARGEDWALILTKKEVREFAKPGGFGCAPHFQAAANVLNRVLEVHNLREGRENPVEPRIRRFQPSSCVRRQDEGPVTSTTAFILFDGVDHYDWAYNPTPSGPPPTDQTRELQERIRHLKASQSDARQQALEEAETQHTLEISAREEDFRTRDAESQARFQDLEGIHATCLFRLAAADREAAQHQEDRLQLQKLQDEQCSERAASRREREDWATSVAQHQKHLRDLETEIDRRWWNETLRCWASKSWHRRWNSAAVPARRKAP